MDESLKNRTIDVLEREQNQLDEAFKPQSPNINAPKKIEKITVKENDDGTYSKNVKNVDSNLYDDNVVGTVEEQIKKDAETLQQFCKEIDNTIINFNAQINAKKQELVNLSTEAINRNCWAGIAYSTLTSGGFSPQSDPLLQFTQNYGTDYTIIEDREAVEIYTNMAGPKFDYGADNPFDPDNIITLRKSYSGFGYETNRDNGRLLSGDATTEIQSGDYEPQKTNFQSSTVLGIGRDNVSTLASEHSGPRNVGPFRGYAGVGVAPYATDTSLTGTGGQNRCVAIASSIATIISEIQSLRSQRDSSISRSSLNAIKEKKMHKELQNWGAENVKKKQKKRKNSNASIIAAIKSIN